MTSRFGRRPRVLFRPGVELLEARTLLTVTPLNLERRLFDLGFPGQDGLPLVADGTLTVRETWAVKLFKATLDPNGAGDPNHMTDFVDLETERWLFASNAPRWVNLPANGPGWVREEIASPSWHKWGTGWAVDLIAEAAVRNTGPVLSVGDLSRVGGGDTSRHSDHEAGMDIDVETPSTDDGSIPFFKTITLPIPGPNTFIAAQTASDPNGDHSIVYLDPNDSTKLSAGPLDGDRTHALVHTRDIYESRELLAAMRDLIVDRPGYSYQDVKKQIDAFRGINVNGAAVRDILYNDPRTWDDPTGLGGFVRFSPGHGGHFHVNVVPPSSPESNTPDIWSVFNAGAAFLRDRPEALQGQALHLDLPVLADSIADGLGLGGRLSQAFNVTIAPNSDPETASDRLVRAGFDIEHLSETPSPSRELLRVRKRLEWTALSGTFEVGGAAGLSYFQDGVRGELEGSLRARSDVVVLDVTAGVALIDNEYTFFLGDATTLTVQGLSGQGAVTGELSLRSLADVEVRGTAEVHLSAGLALRDPDGDHLLRLSDLGLAGTVVGDVNGWVGLSGVQLTAHLPLLPDLSWTGSWRRDVVHSVFGPDQVTLNAPSATQVLEGLGRGFIKGIQSVSFVGQLADKLVQPLPLLDRSVGGLLGIEEELQFLANTFNEPDSNLVPESIRDTLRRHNITTNVTPASVDQLIRGEDVDLLTFSLRPDPLEWNEELYSGTLFSLGIPKILSVDVDARVGVAGSFQYELGLGLGTGGVWISNGTGLHLEIQPYVEIEGSGKVVGIPLASVTGHASFVLTGSLKVGDPTPGDGKVYLREIFREGDNVFQSFLDALDVSLTGDAVLGVTASVDLFLFSWSESFEQRYRIFNLRHEPRFPGQSVADGGESEWPIEQTADGTLTFHGSDGADVVRLSGGNGVVVVDWVGHGSPRRFENVQRVRFRGGARADRLEVADGFNLPIDADGGDGNDYLQGGTAADTLLGGDGRDTLDGGRGADVLQGHDGNDVLWGGDGDDRLLGDGDDDQLHGGQGNDTLDGSLGSDRLQGEAGNDSLSGGDGDDVISGGEGDDTADGGAGFDWLTGEQGADRLDGGPDADVISGGEGSDLLRGGDGGDQLTGEGGDDTLLGEAGNDTLEGADGNDSLLGGTDNDLLQGDEGDDQLTGDEGDDHLGGGEGDDVLQGGAGNDVLNGGAGQDTADGGGGDDTLVAAFDTVGGVVIDRFVGGTDRDTLVVVATFGDDYLTLVQLDTTTFEAVRRNRLIPGDAGRRLAFTLPGDVEVLGLDAGRGNDLVVVDPAVTRNLLIEGGAGNDTLLGAHGRDTIDGSDGDDVLSGFGGADELRGGAGNDLLDGDDGDDVLHGGQGDDTLRGGTDRDVLYGGDGADRLEAGLGLLGDLMYGDGGDDVLIGGEGVDVASGGDGNDLILGGGLLDILQGGSGADTLVGEAGRDFLFGDDGADRLWAADNPAARLQAGLEPFPIPAQADWLTQYGDLLQREGELTTAIQLLVEKQRSVGLTPEEEADLLRKSRVRAAINLAQLDLDPNQDILVETLVGGADADELHGSPNPDVLRGGAGDDTIFHSPGNDSVQGEEGAFDRYVLDATAGSDVIDLTFDPASQIVNAVINGVAIRADMPGVEVVKVDAQGGDDLITVRFGAQAAMLVEIDGGDGNDFIDASTLQAASTLRGGAGDDLLLGGMSTDLLEGGDSSDSLLTADGNDTLRGGLGVDTLHGGEGDDVLYGELASGGEADSLDGGPGTGDRLLVEGTDGPDPFDFSDLAATPAGIERLEVRAGAGDDLFTIGVGGPFLHIDGGPGTNRLTIVGNDNANQITLSQGGETLTVSGDVTATLTGISFLQVFGGGGNDSLDGSGLSLDATLSGGAGDDTLSGGAGNDLLAGDEGNDLINGGSGNDTLRGVSGSDQLQGAAGDDVLYLSGGGSFYDGGDGHDRVTWKANATDTVVLFGSAFQVNGAMYSWNNSQGLEGSEVDTGGEVVYVFRAVDGPEAGSYGVIPRDHVWMDGQPRDVPNLPTWDYRTQFSDRQNGNNWGYRANNGHNLGLGGQMDFFASEGRWKGDGTYIEREKLAPAANQQAIITWESTIQGTVRVRGVLDNDVSPFDGAWWYLVRSNQGGPDLNILSQGRVGYTPPPSPSIINPLPRTHAEFDVLSDVRPRDIIFLVIDAGPSSDARDDATLVSWGVVPIRMADSTNRAGPVFAPFEPTLYAEAESSGGASVSLPVLSAKDDGVLRGSTPSLASGSLFPVGTTTVTYTAQDSSGVTSTAPLRVIVRDTTPPTFGDSLPNLFVPATSADGAVVHFDLPAATDAVTVQPMVVAGPTSGSLFPIGTTQVAVTVTDEAGNASTTAFTVTVRDTTAPTLTSVPGDLSVEATNKDGAIVTFPQPTAVDIADPNPTVTASRPSGSRFPLGTTPVTFTATDRFGNVSRSTILVTVEDQTAPTLTGVSGHMTVQATQAAGAVVTFAAPTATDAVDSNPLVKASHLSGTVFPVGTTSVKVKTVDHSDNFTESTFTVTVLPTNLPPVSKDDSYVTEEDSLLLVGGVGLLVNDLDTEGDSLTAFLVESPAHGTLTLNPNGSFRYAPDQDFHGADRFTYRSWAGGADGNVATVTLTVRSINDLPEPLGDAYRTEEDTPLLIASPGVLLNDTDRDGSVLTALLIDGPTHGRLTLEVNGAFRYTPDENFSGTDQFRYKAHDGAADSATVVVTLTVDPRNDLPSAISHGFALDEDASLSVPGPGLLAGSSDVENDALGIEVVRMPQHGSLLWSPNGSFTYSPSRDYYGIDSFTYRVTDGNAVSDLAVVTLTVRSVYDPPPAALTATAPAPPAPVPAGATAQMVRVRGRFQVQVFDPVTGAFRGGIGTFRTRVRVSYADLDGDGVLDILVRERKGKRFRTRAFSGIDLRALPV